MKQVRVVMLSLLMVLLCGLFSAAQQSATAASATVPPLMQFSNVATDEGGNSLSGVVSLTFSLYAAQQGGEPLWTETQNNVPLDPTGHYSVQLGITKPGGVPTTLFTTGEARWLGVRIAEQPEQPRVLLLSVPYAMKAGDAATIGGLPPSAFVLAALASGITPAYTTELATGQNVSPATPTDVTTSGGTVNFIPLWDSTSDIIGSVLFQSGTGSTAKVGINTATPATTLDVKGGSTIRGTLSLPATGKATATKGTNSQPLNLAASAYNSSTPAAVNQTFQWLAEPAGNDTSTPSGTLNLLFGSGTTKPSETGLDIASNGQITFATGQTFPGTGTGDGTVTSVGSGAGLTGGPITGSGTLSIPTGGVTNAMLATSYAQLGAANIFTANQTVTGEITAGTGSGSIAGVLGESLATSGQTFGVGGFTSSPAGYGVEGLDIASSGGTAGYFQVNTGSATILQGNNGSTAEFRVDSAGDVIAAGVVAASSLQIAGGFFATQSPVYDNLTVGWDAGAGGSSSTALGVFTLANNAGSSNTATGYSALCDISSGNQNTATGVGALCGSWTGSDNTAIGYMAGDTTPGTNLTGSYNTALGANAFFGTTTLNNATAIGANAQVSESNALVLGGITGVNGGTSVNVGIGTSAPTAALDVVGNSLQALIGDPGCGSGFAGVGFVNKGGFNSCKNYALLGDVPGNLYLNSSLTGTIYFRNNNGTLMTVNTAGVVSAKGGFSGQCVSSGAFDNNGGASCNMDLAEAYTSAQATEAGDLVALVPTSEATVRKSSKRYEPLLLGVVSTNPGLVFDNGKTHLAGDNSVAASVSSGLKLISTGNSDRSFRRPNSSKPAPISRTRG